MFFVCILTVTQGAATENETYFAKTELQLHVDFNRQPIAGDILTMTLEHYSEWKYGDNFFFLDIEGKPNFKTDAETLYYEYIPRLSLDKVFSTRILPGNYLGELYATIQYNNSDRDFINQVWLYGVSIDLLGQPNYGFSNVHFLIREEETQDTSYQLTLAWGQPFRLGDWHFVFNGFVDYWKDDSKRVFLAEPQLRIPLSNIVGKENILSNTVVGSEIEITKDLFGKGYGWEINPTLFFSFQF